MTDTAPADPVARPSGFTIMVSGSRDWADARTVAAVFDRLHLPGRVRVLHGGARGLDTIAADVARARGWEAVPFPADWQRHGRGAGPIRNREMLALQPSLLLAFPGRCGCVKRGPQIHDSHGTADAMGAALAVGVPVLRFPGPDPTPVG